MADCVSDAYGSADNSEIVAAINACCAIQHADSVNILTELQNLSTEHAECCDEINANLTTIGNLLSTINDKL